MQSSNILNAKMKSSANLADRPNDESPKNDEENQSIVATLVREYADMTLVHGIKFIANKKASLPER